MELRPHHLLCTQSYRGKGYSEAFVRNMDCVTGYLRSEKSAVIKLVCSTDSLCACCPHKKGENLCDENEKVTGYDQKVLRYFGLTEKEYIYQELAQEIREKMTPEMLDDICGGCEWLSICREILQ